MSADFRTEHSGSERGDKQKAIALIVITRYSNKYMSKVAWDLPGAANQGRLVTSLAEQTQCSISQYVAIFRRSKKTNPVSDFKFAECLEIARQHSAHILVADVLMLVRGMDQEAAVVALEQIGLSDVRVFSAVHKSFVDEIPEARRRTLVRIQMNESRVRSNNVRLGIARKRTARAPCEAPIEAAPRGAHFRAEHRRQTQMIGPKIAAIIGELPEKDRTNMSAIAARLADDGVRTARGGRWTHKQVKRYWETYCKLEAERAEKLNHRPMLRRARALRAQEIGAEATDSAE